MKGDFTRFSHQASQHYAGVLMQQGRVTLDADWNEQFDIEDHRWRVQTIDTIGRACAPIGNDGFELRLTPDGTDLIIKPGRIYIDGILVELDPEPEVAVLDVAGEEWIVGDMAPGGRAFVEGQWVLVSSPADDDVVGRIVTVADNSVNIAADVSLDAHAGSGAATIRRLSTYLAQPYFPADFGAVPPADPFTPEDWANQTHVAYLQVWRRHVTAVEDPAIREVALGGPDTATRVQTVWAVRLLQGDPGSCTGDLDAWDELTAPSGGRMSAVAQAAPDPDDDCKVLPDAGYRGIENRLYRVEIDEPGALGTATFKWSRDNGSILTAITDIDTTEIQVASLGRDEPTSFQADDQVEVLSDETELSFNQGQMAAIVGSPDTQRRTMTLDVDVSAFAAHTNPRLRRWDHPAASIVTGPGPIELDDAGIEVSFSGGPFQVGDHWVIPARVATGDIEGFTDAAPRGIRKHYARLALVTWPDDREGGRVQDCRRQFAPLCELPGRGDNCATVTVGDGVNSVGEFDDIQDAIDSLPPDRPAVVSILPGIYTLPGTVLVRRNLTTIHGCGNQTLLRTQDREPAFLVTESEHVRLESLTIHAGADRGAVVASRVAAFTVAECDIDNGHAPLRDDVGVANQPPGPAVHVDAGVAAVVAGNQLNGFPGISMQGRALDVRLNSIRGGGIWARDGSNGVRIAANTVRKGRGPGIGLGSLGVDEQLGQATGVRDVEIVHNRITSMELSGITTLVPRRSADTGPVRAAVLVRGPGTLLNDGTAGAPFAVAPDAVAAAQPTELFLPRLDRISDDFLANQPADDIAEIVVSGTAPTVPTGPVANVVIAGNTIAGCARAGTHPLVEPEAVGGIVLRDVLLVRIHDNQIDTNGEGVRACGVCLIGCDAVEVSDNLVRRNGAGNAVLDLDFNEVAVGEYPTPMTVEAFRFEADPAKTLSVEDLVIVRALRFATPLTMQLPREVSQAELTIHSESSVRVDAVNASGNVVATAEGLPKALDLRYRVKGDPFTTLRVTPRDDAFLVTACLGSACTAQQAGIAILEVTSRLPGVAAARVHDNVVSAPRGPALVITGAGAMSVADNNLTSFGQAVPAARRGDALAPALMSLVIPATVFIWNAGRAEIFGALTGWFSDNANVKSFRISSPTSAVMAGFLRDTGGEGFPDGRTLVHGNQVAFNDATGVSRVLSSMAVGSVDDVAINDNQMDIHNTEIALFNTLALGPTVRAADNRWLEPLVVRTDEKRLTVPTKASYLGLGLVFSSASANQAVHCIIPKGILGTVDAGNQEMIALANPRRCPTVKGSVISSTVNLGMVMRPLIVADDASAPIDAVADDSLVMSAVATTLADIRPALTESIALHQTTMAARFTVAGARLEAELGSEDADVVALREAAAAADELRVALNVGTEMEARRVRPTEGHWLVHGTIRSADGKPVAGLKVKLLDPSKQRSDPLGEAKTDEFGNWAITYPECPPGEDGKSPELTLAVHGTRNKLLFDSANVFTLGDAPVDYVELELPVEAAPA